MKKYRFSLEKLRSYKRQMMEREKNKLLSLRNERNRAEEKLHELERDLVNAQKRFQLEMVKGVSAMHLNLFQMQKDANLLEQHDLRVTLRTMDATIERQRRLVVRASQEVSGLDKLEAEQREEYQKLEAKESETMIEEFLSFQMLGNPDSEQ
ncbi:MAG: flagellar FliJ family protein [Ruminococcus sp.]|nr:flagellar FliJ family protein [Ruminococcus sp.]